jgi:hypothetical protein
MPETTAIRSVLLSLCYDLLSEAYLSDSNGSSLISLVSRTHRRGQLPLQSCCKRLRGREGRRGESQAKRGFGRRRRGDDSTVAGFSAADSLQMQQTLDGGLNARLCTPAHPAAPPWQRVLCESPLHNPPGGRRCRASVCLSGASSAVGAEQVGDRWVGSGEHRGGRTDGVRWRRMPTGDAAGEAVHNARRSCATVKVARCPTSHIRLS